MSNMCCIFTFRVLECIGRYIKPWSEYPKNPLNYFVVFCSVSGEILPRML